MTSDDEDKEPECENGRAANQRAKYSKQDLLSCRQQSIQSCHVVFFFQAEDGIRDLTVTGVQTCALPISEQRSDLAQKLISSQESTLRHISRELHDEFGQVLTAIGSMLGRAGKHAPDGSPLREDLKEVQEIAQSTLNNIRTLSQALHPVLLEEAGLESTFDWYIPTVGRQTGLALHYEKTGQPFPVETSAGVHIYRVLQEALNNVSRHSGATDAWIWLRFSPDSLELEVEDHGTGFVPEKLQRGIGLVAMRERAELIGGTLTISPWPQGGTKIRLQIPRVKVDANGA